MAESKNENSIVVAVKEEINRQLANPETMQSLLDTTFKGLDASMMKRALLEGRLRGFSFEEFLNKDVYAIPYAGGYSLITSIDRARKIGARSGVVGVDPPRYETADNGRIVACSITVKKRFADGYVGDFTAEVAFGEYFTAGKNGKKSLWETKPKTMISKVAEMHALRKACPEELAQSYVEEEMQQTATPVAAAVIDVTEHRQKLQNCRTSNDLEQVWADIPGDARTALRADLEDMKAIISAEANRVREAEPVIE